VEIVRILDGVRSLSEPARQVEEFLRGGVEVYTPSKMAPDLRGQHGRDNEAACLAVEKRVHETHLDQPDFEGAKYIYTPPPPKENQEHLWHALATGVLSVVSTDHCPFNWDGQKTLGRDDVSKIPNGGPGIEDRLMMIHNFGVRTGRFSLNRMVELLSTAPAHFFGLYPRKGTIAAGSDADIVVFDPDKKKTISASTNHSLVDYNLFEGTEVTGVPETVLVRGQVIVEGDELVAEPGAGKFVKRARFGEELPGASGRQAIKVG
jgi:dihydropyrimidinase